MMSIAPTNLINRQPLLRVATTITVDAVTCRRHVTHLQIKVADRYEIIRRPHPFDILYRDFSKRLVDPNRCCKVLPRRYISHIGYIHARSRERYDKDMRDA